MIMKKIYLSAFLAAVACNAQSQVLLNEDFSTATGTTPPSGWTTTDVSGSGVNWKFEDNNDWGFDPNITDEFAMLDSNDDGDGDPEDALLTTPAFDASAVNGSLILEFDHEFFQYISSTWSVQVFDGTTWTQVAGGDTDVYPTEHMYIDITAAAGNSPVAQVRFEWTGAWELFWGVDNVKISDITCPQVTNVAVANITTSSFDVSWTAGGSETAWTIEYGPAGFTPGTGTTVPASSSPHTINGLTDGTAYDVYVTANCGVGDDSNPVMTTVTTVCYLPAITAYPWTEDFESTALFELPCGWQQLDLNNDEIVWQVSDDNASSGSNSLTISYNSDYSMDDWAYTPAFTMTGGTNYLMQFKYAAYDDFFPESFEVAASGAQDPSSNISTLATFTNFTNTDFITYTVLFTPATSGDYYFGFHGMSDPDEYEILIDDILVDLAPSCMPVTDFAVSPSTNAAELSWNAYAGQTNWEIEYGPAGFTPGSGTVIPVTTTDTTISGLSYSTSYDFYVYANCGSGDYSDTSMINISTLCGIPAITAYPWMENFDTTNLDEVPCGWSVNDANGDDTYWGVSDYSAASPSNSLAISWDSSMDMDDWAMTPGFSMSAGVPYRFIFSYATNGDPYLEDFSIQVGTAQSSSALTTQLANYTGLNNTDFITDTILFTPSATAVYYFGFHGYSIADQDMIFIDDVIIQETCNPESAAFSYSNDTLCENSGLAMPTVTGTTGGVFSADNGLAINPTTGQINPGTAATGTYTITYISGFTNCSDTMSMSIVISPCGLGIEENALSGATLFPNPTSSNVTVTIPAEAGNGTYTVMDATGKSLSTGTLSSEKLTVDFSGQSNGIYLLVLHTAIGEKTFRIAVNK